MTLKVEVADLESMALGRRLREILLDKGKAYSLRAMEMRTGISKDVLLRIIKGERYFKPSEIEVVAKSFDMTVDRFKGIDIMQRLDEVSKLISKQTNLKRALQLAIEIASVASGCSEKFIAHNNVGVIYFLLADYEKAITSYQIALPEAKKLHENFGEAASLYKVSANLVSAYIQVKDFHHAFHLLQQIENEMDNFEPLWAGNLCYSQAMIAYNMGNLDYCRVKMYDQLKFYDGLSPLYKGIAFQNVGYIEYLLGNYSKAREYFELAIRDKQLIEEAHRGEPWYFENRLLSVKDYVKCLLKLNDGETAMQILHEVLDELQEHQCVLYEAKFLILLGVCSGEHKHAERVLELEGISDNLKAMACDCLIKIYANLDESDQVLKYYKKVEEIKKLSHFSWEGL